MRKLICLLSLVIGSACAVTYTPGQMGVLTAVENDVSYTVVPLTTTPVGEVFLYTVQAQKGELSLTCKSFMNLGQQDGETVIRVREFANSGAVVAMVAGDLSSADQGKRSAAAMAACIEGRSSQYWNDYIVHIPKGTGLALSGNLRAYTLKLDLDQFQRATPTLELLK